MILPRSGGAGEPARAVVADAGDWSLRALASLLAADGIEVISVGAPGQLLDQVERSHPHLVVLGSRLGTAPAEDVIRLLRELPNFDRATPVVVASAGMVGEAERIGHLRAGAWESVGLPLNAEELLLRIRRFIEGRRATDEARVQRLLDPQSGFYNLSGFLRRAGEEGAEAWRTRRPLAFAVFRPDPESCHFVEAEPQHPSARTLQRQLIETFRRLGRRSDVIGRRGPLTFLVLAPATDEIGIRRLAERFLAEMHHLATEPVAGKSRPVTMEVGCHATGGPAAGGTDHEELLSRAAGALLAPPSEPAEGPQAMTGADEPARVRLWRHGLSEDRSILEPDPVGHPHLHDGLARQA